MQNTTTYTTIFHRKSSRCLKPNYVVLYGSIALMIGGFLFALSSERYTYGGPGLLVLYIAWKFGANRREEVFFFIQRNVKGDVSYGYLDDDKKRHGDLPVEEYSHWYVGDGSEKGKNTYTLVFMIRNSGQTVYLKEEVELPAPPESWSFDSENPSKTEGTYLVPGLRELVTVMDTNAPVAAKPGR